MGRSRNANKESPSRVSVCIDPSVQNLGKGALEQEVQKKVLKNQVLRHKEGVLVNIMVGVIIQFLINKENNNNAGEKNIKKRKNVLMTLF